MDVQLEDGGEFDIVRQASLLRRLLQQSNPFKFLVGGRRVRFAMECAGAKKFHASTPGRNQSMHPRAPSHSQRGFAGLERLRTRVFLPSIVVVSDG